MEVIRDQLIAKDELRSVTGWCALKLTDHVSQKHEPDCEIPASQEVGVGLRVPHTQPASETNSQQVKVEEEPTTLQDTKGQPVESMENGISVFSSL